MTALVTLDTIYSAHWALWRPRMARKQSRELPAEAFDDQTTWLSPGQDQLDAMTGASRFKWRQQYDDVADAKVRAATDIHFPEPTKTLQDKAADADLNNIVHRFGITDGAIPPMAWDPRYFGDFSDAVGDLKTALDITNAARQAFDQLPVDIRRRFGHNPAELHEWINRPENAEEAVTLGLLAKRPEQVPEGVRSRRELDAWMAKPENRAEAERLRLIGSTPPAAPETPPNKT